MKDEEMAEEYICNGKCQDDITKNYTHCKTCTRIKDFLAGLKAGRPQWHYMKDVNCYEDLPHNEDVYYAYVVNVGAYDKPTIERKLGSFAEFEFDVMAYHVIAWCEIPTFDKESEIKREIFPEITLPEESAEFVDKIIVDAEKRLKENE